MTVIKHIAIAALIGLGTTTASHAGNGALGYAHRTAIPVIDGDLSDWTGQEHWQPVTYNYDAGADGALDFQAFVRCAYNAEDEAFYVAVRVEDDAHITSDDLPWRSTDAAIVYLDATHSPNWSGVLGYVYSGAPREITGQQGSWDPEAEQADWSNVTAASSRHGNTTTYEFRFELGEFVHPGRVIGADLAIVDTDADNASRTLHYWGPYFNKPGQAGRMGDVLLVDPDQPLLSLSGSVQWTDGLEPLPGGAPLVRVTHVDQPELWVQLMGDDEGRYGAELPPGTYDITYPLPILGRLLGPHDRIAKGSKVTVTLGTDEAARAPDFILAREPQPDLYPDEGGVLFDWTASRQAELDRFMAAWMDYFQIPGASLAIVHDNQIAYHQVYGVANNYTREPVTPETIFEAASITKIVFAFAVHRLAEQGVIDLDRPLHTYLAFEELQDDPRYLTMTARHVLTHQTGLPNWRSGDITLAFAPGEGVNYSGEGMEYLKRVVMEITGKPIEDILMDEVQRPMGFETRTYFSDNPALREVVAHGHSIERPSAARIPQNPGMAHSMHTEARDLANFMVSLLERRGLSEATYDEMMAFASAAPAEPSEHDLPWATGFGQGFGLAQTPYGVSFGHGGNNGDFMSRFDAFPDHGIGFVIMTNNERGWALSEVLRRYLIAGGDVPSSLEQPAPAWQQD